MKSVHHLMVLSASLVAVLVLSACANHADNDTANPPPAAVPPPTTTAPTPAATAPAPTSGANATKNPM